MQSKKLTRRQKGEGSLIQLSNGNYKMTITIGQGIDGKQKRRSVTASTKQEVFDRIAAIRLDKTPLQAREMTFKQLYEEFKRETFLSKSDGTKDAYQTMYSHIENELANTKLNHITPQYLSSLLLSMKNKKDADKALSPSTLLLDKRLLNAIFNYALAKEYILKNPVHGTLKGVKERRRVDLPVINDGQLKQILEDAKHHDKLFFPHSDGIHWYPLLLFTAVTGLRRGEVLGLRKSCVDLENGIIEIKAQVRKNTPDLPLKTEKAHRKIRVNAVVLKIVMDDVDPESEFVFANRRTHKHLSISTLTSSFNSFIKFYGHKPFPTFTFNNLRHYNATKLVTAEEHIDIVTISRRLGHADPHTTYNRYAHFSAETDAIAKDVAAKNLIEPSANPSAYCRKNEH